MEEADRKPEEKKLIDSKNLPYSGLHTPLFPGSNPADQKNACLGIYLSQVEILLHKKQK